MPGVYDYPTQTRLDGLLVGVFIAWLFHFKPFAREWLAARHVQTPLAGIAVVAISYIFVLRYTPDPTVRAYVGVLALFPTLFLFPLGSIGFGLIVVSAISPKSFLYNLQSKPLGLVATLSYSLGRLSGPVMFFLCLGSALGFALLMHHAIERPAFRLRDWLLAKRSVGKAGC